MLILELMSDFICLAIAKIVYQIIWEYQINFRKQ